MSCIHSCLVSMCVLYPFVYCIHSCLVSICVLYPFVSCIHLCLVSIRVLYAFVSCIHSCLVSICVLYPFVSCIHLCLVSMLKTICQGARNPGYGVKIAGTSFVRLKPGNEIMICPQLHNRSTHCRLGTDQYHR